jgi:hypothetical protein
MGVSRLWRAFLTTFDRNHDRKCGKRLKLKVLCIRNLFHQDIRWMENSIATSWGKCGKTSGANLQTSGATTPWQHSGSSVACCVVYDSLPPPSLLIGPRPLWFSPVLEDEIDTQGATFWQLWSDPDRIADRDEDADAKWLPEVPPIMEIPLEMLYQCQRGLLRRGWGANRNFGKWLSYGRGISGTFG